MLIKANHGTDLLDLIDISMDSFRKTGKTVYGKIQGFVFEVNETFEVTVTIRLYEEYLNFAAEMSGTEDETFEAFLDWREFQKNPTGKRKEDEVLTGPAIINSMLDELLGNPICEETERPRRIQLQNNPAIGFGHIQGMTKVEVAIMQKYVEKSSMLVMRGLCSPTDQLEGMQKLIDKMEESTPTTEFVDKEDGFGNLLAKMIVQAERVNEHARYS